LCCVKHLNPRQGITIYGLFGSASMPPMVSVKHLNPRQGITMHLRHRSEARRRSCVV